MSDWRDHILQHFREPSYRLNLVADPDGFMLEEELLVAIRQNGFDLLSFEGYDHRFGHGRERQPRTGYSLTFH